MGYGNSWTDRAANSSGTALSHRKLTRLRILTCTSANRLDKPESGRAREIDQGKAEVMRSLIKVRGRS